VREVIVDGYDVTASLHGGGEPFPLAARNIVCRPGSRVAVHRRGHARCGGTTTRGRSSWRERKVRQNQHRERRVCCLPLLLLDRECQGLEGASHPPLPTDSVHCGLCRCSPLSAPHPSPQPPPHGVPRVISPLLWSSCAKAFRGSTSRYEKARSRAASEMGCHLPSACVESGHSAPRAAGARQAVVRWARQ